MPQGQACCRGGQCISSTTTSNRCGPELLGTSGPSVVACSLTASVRLSTFPGASLSVRWGCAAYAGMLQGCFVYEQLYRKYQAQDLGRHMCNNTQWVAGDRS
eukprot:1149815-Pelagomonas_calceolata.AAC.3